MSTTVLDQTKVRNPTLLIVLALVALSMSIWLEPLEGLVAKRLQPSDLLQIISTLFLIALVVERALEVFITTLRGPTGNDLDLKIQACKRELAQAKTFALTDAAKLQEANAALAKAEQEWTAYKSQTQRIALWAGLTLGLLVSAVFFRVLGQLVDVTAGKAAPQNVFYFVDVLVTGGLIAGGSDGIHKLANVYTSFMDSTAKLAAKRAEP